MARFEHIPLDLLQTFVRIADLDGDATKAAEQLAITQPTISKRLAALRRATSDPDRQPWLILKGKRWKVTPEGERVRGVVTELVESYDRMQQFVTSERTERSGVSIACGQQAASGFVKLAIEQFLKKHPGSRVRLSTPRGKARIEGVAGGQFDLAIVTDSHASIRRIARMELHIETLFEDQFVVVGNPSNKAEWSLHWHSLPIDRPVSAKDLLAIPLILPEPDSSRRKQFDEWGYRANSRPFDVVLETGGWRTIIDFAHAGFGVGLAPYGTVASSDLLRSGGLSMRQLNPKDFPPDGVRLIARKMHKFHQAELSPTAAILADFVRLPQTTGARQ